MRAKDFLLQHKKIDKMIENKLIEQQLWREQATGTTSTITSDKVQSSGNPHRMADAIGRYIDMENEINKDIDILVDIKKDIISVIEQLEVTEYDVLYKMYVGVIKSTPKGKKRYYYSLDDVADAYEKTYSWATTMHGRALKSVQDILNKREYEGNR